MWRAEALSSLQKRVCLSTTLWIDGSRNCKETDSFQSALRSVCCIHGVKDLAKSRQYSVSPTQGTSLKYHERALHRVPCPLEEYHRPCPALNTYDDTDRFGGMLLQTRLAKVNHRTSAARRQGPLVTATGKQNNRLVIAWLPDRRL